VLADLHNAVVAVCPILSVRQYEDGRYELVFSEDATEQQKQAAQAIVDAWIDPPEPRLVYALDFLDRFSEDTQLRVVAAGLQNPIIRLWYDRLLANGSVDLNNPRLLAGLNTMRDAGLLTQEEINSALV
jgi:hypothetical protein